MNKTLRKSVLSFLFKLAQLSPIILLLAAVLYINFTSNELRYPNASIPEPVLPGTPTFVHAKTENLIEKIYTVKNGVRTDLWSIKPDEWGNDRNMSYIPEKKMLFIPYKDRYAGYDIINKQLITFSNRTEEDFVANFRVSPDKNEMLLVRHTLSNPESNIYHYTFSLFNFSTEKSEVVYEGIGDLQAIVSWPEQDTILFQKPDNSFYTFNPRTGQMGSISEDLKDIEDLPSSGGVKLVASPISYFTDPCSTGPASTDSYPDGYDFINPLTNKIKASLHIPNHLVRIEYLSPDQTQAIFTVATPPQFPTLSIFDCDLNSGNWRGDTDYYYAKDLSGNTIEKLDRNNLSNLLISWGYLAGWFDKIPLPESDGLRGFIINNPFLSFIGNSPN